MTLNLPSSRTEVTNRLVSDVTAELPDSGSFLRASYLRSVIRALGFRIYDVYQKISIMINQFFVQTATDSYLERWGDTYGVTRNTATASSGTIVFTGTATTSIPSGTSLQSASGIVYETQSDTTISTSNTLISSMSRTGTTVTVNYSSTHGLASGMIIDAVTGATPTDFNTTNATITVTSSTQIQYTLAGTAGSASGSIYVQATYATVEVESSTEGSDTNVDAGGVLTLSSSISGVDNDAYVDIDELSGGTDEESDADYRSRILDRIQQPFSFFNSNALEFYAKTVSGVTRVWVFEPDSTSSSLTISSLTRNDQVATATITSHGLVDGTYITVSGANESEYNVTQQRIIVIDDDTIAYPVSGSPTTPATGTITASYSYVEEGQVRIGFVRDDDDSIIPSATEVNAVEDVILDIKPAHMTDSDVIVFAPTSVSIPVTFSALSPNTTAMQSAITTALQGFFTSSNNIGENVRDADIKAVLNQTIDTSGSTPTYTLSAPSGDTSIGLNEIGILGTITFP